jgi:hypothetical protein
LIHWHPWNLLHIPEDASFTLTTKYVLVQGVMRMDPPTDTTIPRSDGAVVKIVLEGTDDVTFTPDAETDNAMACGVDTPCNIGKRPFAVAGGMCISYVMMFAIHIMGVSYRFDI